LRAVATILGILVVEIVGGLAYIYSGSYDVAASTPDNPIVGWILGTTSDRSVSRQAEGIVAPTLTNPVMIGRGLDRYREDCAQCHGAPGKYPTELAEGMTPQPPRLWESVKDMSPGEVFWVVKHGIKMTGMPAWAHAYKDDDIWSVVAFLKQSFPTLSADEYKRLDQEAAQKKK
jgi:mono/diheme cytochrome c family protein